MVGKLRTCPKMLRIGLQPHLKYIGFVRILDIGWKVTTRVQIWISVDL